MLESLPPVVGTAPRILILGSMPGAESLRLCQYYAHPQNRFFKIMFRYFGQSYTDDYKTRKALLLGRGIALWDTIRSCARENSSLDSRIVTAVPNDIAGFLKEHSQVRAVLTNGNKSRDMLKLCLPDVPAGVAHRPMPSTSPANARFSTDALFAVWKQAMDEFLVR